MKVLVVDDAQDISEIVSLCFELRWPGTQIVTATEGLKGVQMVGHESPDLVILDIGLPDIDGFEVCKQIRAFSDVPIIMLTVRNLDTDVVKGLQAGADDFISKPFSHIALIARSEAVLRRSQGTASSSSEEPFEAGALRIDFGSRTVWVNKVEVRLTPTEYSLLYQLVRNSGRVLTHKTLMTKVWGPEYETTTNYLKIHIQHLRQKLGDDPQSPSMIQTGRGVGYMFIKPTQGGSPKATNGAETN